MFEAFDHDAVDKVLALLGAPADKRCDTNETANSRRIFTMYVDRVDFMYRNYLDSEWSNKKLKELFKKIQNFEAAA